MQSSNEAVARGETSQSQVTNHPAKADFSVECAASTKICRGVEEL
jgi:hypothetical protein